MAQTFFALQPAFTGGEISGEVASRVDLEKYQLALLQAENAIIRPYGPVYKRPGTIYAGRMKYDDRDAILTRFEFTVEITYLLEVGDKYIRVWRDGVRLPVELETPFDVSDLRSLRFVQCVDVMYICSGRHPVQKLSRYAENDWRMSDVKWMLPAYGDVNIDEESKVTPSGSTGDIQLTATKDIFTDARVGDTMKIEQYVNGATVTYSGGGTADSGAIQVGKTWKFITHGTWSGKVVVQQSRDNGATWIDLRTYTGSNDYNPTESGDVDEYCMMRIHVEVGGSVRADLSAYPYRHEGFVTITAVTDGKHASVTADKPLGGLEPTSDWYWGAWSETNGYPRAAAFFQDRLCFGGNRKYPQRVWMSRSGDYEHFGIEKESGTVTDDSSISADLLSRQAYSIAHMDVGNDLMIFTDGNTWTIAGGETVKPTNITPKNQENYGSSGVPPLRIGNRIIYVQRRGSIVRDTGYSYESDGYVGMDLTLLAKHLVRGREIVSAAYAQEPDSLAYFVTDDGRMLCLTYVVDQKVYAWSHFVTDGKYKAVCAANSGNNDRIYAVVERVVDGKTVRYLEYFAPHTDSSSEQDYVMADAAVVKVYDEPQTDIPGKDVLKGKVVAIMADGYYYDGITLDDSAKLPKAARKITVGLPYTMTLEQPNWDAGTTETGTLQGRRKMITGAILRLVRSYGGSIGQSAGKQDAIIYDAHRLETDEDVLYTGDKDVVLPAGGWDTEGRTYIVHDAPYPFSLSAIIRRVSIGG
ncbi:hypothetical protein TAMA11512_09190 [Selenomonas sp. TAMA-11512]|uniref:hypothetical protein n=1 Tax=Selenomonas sp. TAMA-11512 TaxID=3095337 RepID=UPI00308E7DBF|nr:hypothetical protein TAMA11512_09190 [Selenomonas sp. TAMA-11512]